MTHRKYQNNLLGSLEIVEERNYCRNLQNVFARDRYIGTRRKMCGTVPVPRTGGRLGQVDVTLINPTIQLDNDVAPNDATAACGPKLNLLLCQQTYLYSAAVNIRDVTYCLWGTGRMLKLATSRAVASAIWSCTRLANEAK